MTTCLTTRSAPRPMLRQEASRFAPRASQDKPQGKKQQARRKSGTLENAYRRLRLKERAYRFYSPGIGRWINRDPIAEQGGIHLYAFVENDSMSAIDAIGERIVSFEVRGAQGEAGWLEDHFPDRWFRSTDNPFKNAFKGGTLGFQMGKGNEPTWLGYEEYALGGWKFEEKVLWCGKEMPSFANYVSDLFAARKRYSDAKIEVIRESKAEIPDGPSAIEINKSETAIKERGLFVAFAWDAPRLGKEFNSPKKWRYYFTGNWRLVAWDPRSRWEAKVHLSFAFDDDLNASNQVGHFIITSRPKRIP